MFATLQHLSDHQLDQVGVCLPLQTLESMFLAGPDILDLPAALGNSPELAETTDQGDPLPAELVSAEAVFDEEEYREAAHLFNEQTLLLSSIDFAQVKGHLSSVAAILLDEAQVNHPYRPSKIGFRSEFEMFAVAIARLLPFKDLYFSDPHRLAVFTALAASHIDYKDSVRSFRVARDSTLIKPIMHRLSRYLRLLLRFCRNSPSPPVTPASEVAEEFGRALEELLSIKVEDIDIFGIHLASGYYKAAGLHAEVATLTAEQRRSFTVLKELGHSIRRFKPFSSNYFSTPDQQRWFNVAHDNLLIVRMMNEDFKATEEKVSRLQPLTGALSAYVDSLKALREAARTAIDQSARVLGQFEMLMRSMSQVGLEEYKEEYRDFVSNIFTKAGIIHLFPGPRGRKSAKITQMNDLVRSVYKHRDICLVDDNEKAAIQALMTDYDLVTRAIGVFKSSPAESSRLLARAMSDYLKSLHAFVKIVAKRLFPVAPVADPVDAKRSQVEALPESVWSSSKQAVAKKPRGDKPKVSETTKSPVEREESTDEDLLDANHPVMTEEQIEQLAALLGTPED